jgi:hypothetical protein
MSTRYRVPVADALLLRQDTWGHVEGLRLLSQDGPWLGHPDVTICTFEDDGAPASLEGLLVEPVLTTADGVTRVTGRMVVTPG